MWKNYFKIAIRNLLKNKTFSFINIFGLAVSMSVCLLIISMTKDASSFDTFHQETERIYRINTEALRKNGGVEEYATCPYPVGKTLADEYSQVEAFIPFIARIVGDARNEKGDLLMLRGQFTNNAFLETFNFPMQKGDVETALDEPYSVVINQAVAKRFFDKVDPMGKTLEVEGMGKFTITGLLDDFLGKTHLEFEALLSSNTYPLLETQKIVHPVLEDWTNYYSNYNYIKLKEGADLAVVEAALNDIATTRYVDLDLETRDKGYRFKLVPIKDVLLGNTVSNNLGRMMPQMLIWVLSFLGLIVILSACFNYTNLTLARALTRAREIGVRKVMGARRIQVFSQFIIEAVLTTFFALVIGYHFMKVLVLGFNELSLANEFDISFSEDWTLFAWFFLFSIGVGFVAGILPAFMLSKTKPITALQQLTNLKFFSKVGLRKGLLIFQFSLSLVFMILVSVIYQQFQYSMNLDYGFERENILNIQLLGSDYEKMKMEMQQIAAVEDVSAISHLMGTWQDGATDVQKEEADEPLIFAHYFVDEDYVPNLGLKLVAGENFPENTEGGEKFVVVNEKFLEAMELGTPAEAIGQTLILDKQTQVSIQGVLKDFNYKPVQYSIRPLVLRNDEQRLSYLNVKISNADVPAALASLERAWKMHQKEQGFNYEFYKETIRQTYFFTKDLMVISGFFAFLTIVIAALGLLGMATYTVETRSKEIGIRKVIGASFSDLLFLLSKGFFYILAIVVLIALPIGIFLSTSLLQQFAYTVENSYWLYLLPIFGLLFIGILTIGSQTIRAAVNNPVESLRSE